MKRYSNIQQKKKEIGNKQYEDWKTVSLIVSILDCDVDVVVRIRCWIESHIGLDDTRVVHDNRIERVCRVGNEASKRDIIGI